MYISIICGREVILCMYMYDIHVHVHVHVHVHAGQISLCVLQFFLTPVYIFIECLKHSSDKHVLVPSVMDTTLSYDYLH